MGIEAQQSVDGGGESPLGHYIGPEQVCRSLAEFVERKFAPGYVSAKRLAGRAHFQAILKHILTPEAVDRAFGVQAQRSKLRLKTIPGWPYLDSIPLCELTAEKAQALLRTALEHGYSVQTVTHIRNVLRAIFEHARQTHCFAGDTPASLSAPLGISRKEAHTLTLVQLKQVIRAMRYPEREVALFAVLTGMSVAEICGLQWRYVNLSELRRLVDGEWIPSKTIAVRYQSYRGEFGVVLKNRLRILPLPELLNSTLQMLRNRGRFTSPEDFVVPSRSGKPICPDNIAVRRLKVIGRSLEMPWLSWHVFHRAHLTLTPEFGRQLNRELKGDLSIEHQ